jgi:hypothetical protein
VQHEDRARALAEKLGVSVGTDNLAAVVMPTSSLYA